MNNEATIARDSAAHCEAKKHALRQTQDGIVVSFVLHPNDVPASLQLAPLGTRYMLALVEIGDDEAPVKRKEGNQSKLHHVPKPASVPENPARAPRRFGDMSYAEQAGMLCQNHKFRMFVLCTKYPDLRQFAPEDVVSPDEAAEFVRNSCAVQSRKEIQKGTGQGACWESLVARFRAWEMAPSVGVA